MAARPAWTPTQIESALTTTARNSVRRDDAVTPATVFDQGAGTIDVSRAVSAGLWFPVTPAQFRAANPASGGTAPYTWSATGLPTGLSISASGLISGTATTAGTYNVTATATASAGGSGSTSFTWTVGSATCAKQTNGTDVAIPDNSTVTSTITFSGCTGTASASSQVEVHIKHTYKGDLIVNLLAPDGTAYLLHNRTGGSADNIDQTFTVNLSSETRNGTWTLQVRDAATADVGTIDTWSLTL